ncbi:MAG: hypothetical protein DRP60_16015, partial [Spirochaetes bacterium]
MALILILTTLLALSSCSTGSDINSGPETYSDFSLERIDHLLETGDNLRVLPLILSRERDGVESGEKYNQALEGLKAEWKAARSDGDWRKSLVYLRSFRILGV